MKKLILLIFLLAFPFLCFSQYKDKEQSVDISQNLDSCFIKMSDILTEEDIDNFKNTAEDEVPKYHFTIGRLIRNNCGLLAESALAQYFRDKGIDGPDDMSEIVLESFYLYLNKKDFQIDERIRQYQQRQQQQ